MILSRSADYGLRSLVYLACNDTAQYVPLHEISSTMRTPQFLLAHILQRLAKAGIVASMKGHHGGFRLQRSPREITVAQIVVAIDGPIRAMDCTGTADCTLSDDCSIAELFTRVECAVHDTLQATTLEHLTRPYVASNGGVVRFASCSREVAPS